MNTGLQFNTIPDIEVNTMTNNPTMSSPNSPFEISFLQTRDNFLDVETYKAFLTNAIGRFRHSRTYKGYKSYLIGLGLDRCQMHGNITAEMATVEMHHGLLTILDISIIITEHILNTRGYITTFDLVEELKNVHRANMVPLVMLSLTAHQVLHYTDDFYVSPNMMFGNWPKLLQKYNTGITQDIAFKVLFYIKRAMVEDGHSNDRELLNLKQNITDWSGLNNGQFRINS